MAKRQVTWARAVMERLRVVMGRVCVCCGSDENLEMDCREPRGHAHHAVGYVQRATFYRREYEIGNLQLLCSKCHWKKTRIDAKEVCCK